MMRHIGAGIVLCGLWSCAAFAEGYPIAGTQPDRRPEGAPTITQYVQDRAALARYLHGVSQPIPPSISANAKDQGAWFTPFNHPGMSPPYDPRGWHARLGGH